MTAQSSMRRVVIGVGAAWVLVLAGCVKHATDDAAAGGAKMTDAEILGVLSEVNHGEVSAAKLAAERSSTPGVDEFAQHMIHAHSEAQGKVLAVDSLEPDTSGGLSRSLQQQAEGELAKLQGLQGAEFDRAYADSQAKMHQQVLDTIDSKLLPQATKPEVKTLLETLRPQVAEHLAQAQQLGSASPPAGGGSL